MEFVAPDRETGRGAFFVWGHSMRDILDLIFNWSDNRDTPLVVWRDDEGEYLACITLFDAVGQYRWTEAINERFVRKSGKTDDSYADQVWRLMDVACCKARAERMGIDVAGARSKSRVDQLIAEAAEVTGRPTVRALDGRLMVAA